MATNGNAIHRGKHAVKILRGSDFLKHNAIFFAGSLSVAVLNYLFYPVLGRMMAPADFGEVQTLVSLFTQSAIFLTILTYVTIHVTVNVHEVQSRNRTLLGLERMAMLIGWTLLLLGLVFAGSLRDFLNFRDVKPFIALIVALAVSIPVAFRMAFLRGQQQFLRASLTDGIGSAAKLVLAPPLVFAGLKSFGAVTGLAISQVLSLAVAFFWARQAGLRKVRSASEHMDAQLLRPYLKHAAAVLVGAGAVTFLQTIDIVAVKHYFDANTAGLYAGITTISNIVFFLMAPISGVLITSVSLQKPLRDNQRRLYMSLGIMTGLGSIALLVMALFPRLLIGLLVGDKYLQYSGYLPVLGLAMLLLAIASSLTMYHIALKKYRYGAAGIAVVAALLGLMAVNHGTIKAVVTNIISGSILLLLLTATQNFYLISTHKPEEGNA